MNSCIHLLCNYRKFLPQHTLKFIFNCVSFPHLLRKQDIQKLERKYNKCCRVILNDPFSSTDDIYKSLGWLPFTELAEKCRDKLLLSIVRDSFAPILSTYLSRPHHSHNTRFNTSSYNQPTCSKNIGSKSFYYWAPRLLNMLM